MRNLYKLICIIVLTIGAAASAFAVTNTVSCDYTSIANAVAAANDGDVVLIQPGSCTITGTTQIPHNIHLQGSGTNLTTLISGSGLRTVFWSGSVTVSDLNCVGDIANNTGFFVCYGGIFHYYNIKMTNVMCRAISPGYGGSFGLIDHCTFVIGVGAVSYTVVSPQGNGYASWAGANPFGTTNVCCVEDCYFEQTTGNAGNGFFDGYDGAQVVIRHCFFNGGAYNGVHGYDSQPTSTRTLECYNNMFTNWNVNASVCSSRGGGFLFFSNTVYAATGGANFQPGLLYYRGCPCTTYQGFNGFAGYPKVLTFGGNPTDGQTDGDFGTGGYIYTFKNDISSDPFDKIKIGATLGDTLTNLMLMLNGNPGGYPSAYAPYVGGNSPGYGTAFSIACKANPNFRALYVTNGNQIVLQNRMDGTNAYGWPAAMQPGVIGVTEFTDNGVTLFPCYSWSNVVHNVDTSIGSLNFGRQWDNLTNDPPNYITNLIQAGRDYFQDTIAPNYTPLVYPHPLQAAETGGGLTSTQPAPPNDLTVVHSP